MENPGLLLFLIESPTVKSYSEFAILSQAEMVDTKKVASSVRVSMYLMHQDVSVIPEADHALPHRLRS
jgi:hypothetical protein